MKKIISVVGARPNFMKVAPLHRAFEKYNKKQSVSSLMIDHRICHTGQHYDEKMSKIFFEELELPQPDFYLGIGSGSHAEQTGKIMIEFEKILIQQQPALVIVVGDVNSTIACSLTASKLNIPVAHVEAGLRSFDRQMPEEINRLLTDSIANFLFVSEPSGLSNLKNEGVPDEKVFFVGNVMIDSLLHHLTKAEESQILKKLNLLPNEYILVTMHRPSNVDSDEQLSLLVRMLNSLSEKRDIVFPIHPRTLKNLEKNQLDSKLNEKIILTDPIGYIDFLWLTRNAEVVLTDSGGIQEESTFLGIQCVTVRSSTERPVTIEVGTNHLVGDDFDEAEKVVMDIIHGRKKKGNIPELWDGKTSDRIVEIIAKNIF